MSQSTAPVEIRVGNPDEMEIARAYFSAFLAGGLKPFWPHVVLIGGSILAEAAVAWGIILEAPKEKTWREKLGMVLVIGGVVVGALFTILLFTFDEGISSVQQDKISEQQTKISNADDEIAKSANKIAESNDKIVELEGRLAARKLSPEQIRTLSIGLSSFSHQPFEIIPYEVPETQELAAQIKESLLKAGWKYELPPPLFRSVGTVIAGVVVTADKSAPRQFHNAGVKLAAALVADGIVARQVDDDRSSEPNKILIFAGLKP